MANSAYAYTFIYFLILLDIVPYGWFEYYDGNFIPMNFNHPYLAPNPQDFWRRFHITLGTC